MLSALVLLCNPLPSCEMRLRASARTELLRAIDRAFASHATDSDDWCLLASAVRAYLESEQAIPLPGYADRDEMLDDLAALACLSANAGDHPTLHVAWRALFIRIRLYLVRQES